MEANEKMWNEQDLADVIMDRPHEFKVGRKPFRLYPVTLAKMLLLGRHVDGLGLDMGNLKLNPFLVAMRVVRDKREACCAILAYHTAPNTYEDLFDTKSITARSKFFAKSLSDDDLASLLLVALDDKTDRVLGHIGLDREHERLRRVMEVKSRHDRVSASFCGLSLFGTFIAPLMKLGYSEDEILYRRGYTHLRVRLADEVTQVMLTDDERKELPEELGGTRVDASDPRNAERILSMLASGGIGAK